MYLSYGRDKVHQDSNYFVTPSEQRSKGNNHQITYMLMCFIVLYGVLLSSRNHPLRLFASMINEQWYYWSLYFESCSTYLIYSFSKISRILLISLRIKGMFFYFKTLSYQMAFSYPDMIMKLLLPFNVTISNHSL